MAAYYRSALIDFTRADPLSVLGYLTAGYSKEGFASQYTSANEAWDVQIKYLQTLAINLIREIPTSAGWNVLLEYPIPRRTKRIDAVLLAEDVIFVMEFKTGEGALCQADFRQVEDYCLDLRDFQAESESRFLVPMLIAPSLPDKIETADLLKGEYVQLPQVACGPSSVPVIVDCFRAMHRNGAPPIDPGTWDHSAYCPTPTIIEAAQRLYANHSVHEIARSHAGAENLTLTAQAVLRVIADAQTNRRKAICFITGVPGAGKTLAGLNVVHNRDLHKDQDALGVFLSGNGPLVKVLTEALARDRQNRLGGKLDDARHTVSTFLQNVHRFLREYSISSSQTPKDHVVVFDEAQRAWDARQSFQKFKRSESEPNLMLRIMDRHSDWAVIVALIGSGQEINSGEAGLPEWGRALIEQFSNWDVHISPQLAGRGVEGNEQVLLTKDPGNLCVKLDPHLHLSVCIRSFRANSLADWVDAVLLVRQRTLTQIPCFL